MRLSFCSTSEATATYDAPALPLPTHHTETVLQITCLYDMDIPRPDNFNECYLYEGNLGNLAAACALLTEQQSSWSAI